MSINRKRGPEEGFLGKLEQTVKRFKPDTPEAAGTLALSVLSGCSALASGVHGNIVPALGALTFSAVCFNHERPVGTILDIKRDPDAEKEFKKAPIESKAVTYMREFSKIPLVLFKNALGVTASCLTAAASQNPSLPTLLTAGTASALAYYIPTDPLIPYANNDFSMVYKPEKRALLVYSKGIPLKVTITPEMENYFKTGENIPPELTELGNNEGYVARLKFSTGQGVVFKSFHTQPADTKLEQMQIEQVRHQEQIAPAFSKFNAQQTKQLFISKKSPHVVPMISTLEEADGSSKIFAMQELKPLDHIIPSLKDNDPLFDKLKEFIFTDLNDFFDENNKQVYLDITPDNIAYDENKKEFLLFDLTCSTYEFIAIKQPATPLPFISKRNKGNQLCENLAAILPKDIANKEGAGNSIKLKNIQKLIVYYSLLCDFFRKTVPQQEEAQATKLEYPDYHIVYFGKIRADYLLKKAILEQLPTENSTSKKEEFKLNLINEILEIIGRDGYPVTTSEDGSKTITPTAPWSTRFLEKIFN